MNWLWFAIITTIAWGVWGSLIELPDKGGFHPMKSYVVWALTMVPCALFALWQNGWKLERSRSAIVQGCIVGLLGAGGQLVLFKALQHVPAYIAFPIVNLYPVVTVILSTTLLREHASRRQWIGVAIALPAIGLITYASQQPSESGAEVTLGGTSLILAIGVFVAWGLQAYVMKTATRIMSAEGLFVYMAITALVFIPAAMTMIEPDYPVQWPKFASWNKSWVVALIQVLNAIGALTLVHAMRHGKALIVTPLTALAPVITVLLSLAIYSKMPSLMQSVGFVFAAIAIYLLAE